MSTRDQRLAILQKKLEDLRSSGRRGDDSLKIWFKPKEEETVVRLVPYQHQDGVPFIEVFHHYDIGGEKSIVCPKLMEGKPCPICDLAENIRSKGGEDNWKLYKDLKVKSRTYSPIVIRGREDEGIFLWGYGKKIADELISKSQDPEWGELYDPKSGRDITVWLVKRGQPGNEAGKYDLPFISVKPKESPMLGKVSDIKELIASIPDFWKEGKAWPMKSHEELCQIVEKMGDVEEEESSFDFDYGDSEVDEKEESNDKDDLKSKLDKLLDE